MNDQKKLEPGIVYNSGMTVPTDQLATLAIFYERIYLPYFSSIFGLGSDFGFHLYVIEPIEEWDDDNAVLYNESVLLRLPSPYMGVRPVYEQVAWPRERGGLNENELLAWHSTPADYSFHIRRRDIDYLPRVFSGSHREALVSLEALAAFKYLLPKIEATQPDEILELRRKVKNTREGFTMHLQKLSKGLDGMMKAGEKLEDLKGYAQNIVETDLIPDYREFRRQLQAEQAGKIKKVLDVAGKIMEIDAAPWTPKFWGLLLKALGMSAIETAADQKERLSNRYQAYEFMKTVEDVRSSKPKRR